MVDPRFHNSSGPASLAGLLAAVGEEVHGLGAAGELTIEGADELHLAGPGQLALAAHRDYREALRITGAGAVIVSAEFAVDVPGGTVAVVSANPHVTFAKILDRLYPADTRETVMGLLGPRELPFTEADVRIGPGVVLGPGVEIGRGTVIGPNTVIGAGVAIGRNCIISNNCSIECAYIGNGVVLHPGVRIGQEGFGWLEHGVTNRKIPQLGRVIVQDRVEIGANTTVDRGALGDTVIGEGTKIDNLVQIGHNCQIGRNCLIAATVALAGSNIVEDSVMFGGGSGASGHLTIGQGSVLAARTVVTKDIPPQSRVAGFPAQDIEMWRREIATLRRLSKRTERGR